MESSSQTVSPLRQRMIEDMRMRKLCEKTQIAYIRAVRKLAAYLKRSPDTATAEELRRFCRDKGGMSKSDAVADELIS